MKKTFYTELSYLLGLVILAFGTALMERADFGMSMVVAPAYLVHLKLVQILPWFSFGVAEYCLQGLLLALLAAVMGKFKRKYLFSLVTAVLYGMVLDGCIALVGLIGWEGIAMRISFFVLGLLLCSLGVALFFHTYITPEAYELLVKEISEKFGTDLGKTKTIYDCVSCLTAVVLSFVFFGFGHFEGVKWGTVLCALVNGSIIGLIDKGLGKAFSFRDGLKLRKFF